MEPHACMPSLPQPRRRAAGRSGSAPSAIRADAERKARSGEVPSLDAGDRVSHDSFGLGHAW